MFGKKASVEADRQREHLVVPLRLVLLEEGIGAEADVAVLHVDLPAGDLQVEDVVVVNEGVLDAVDVRQLVPVRVHIPEVRVALHDDRFRGDRVDDLPRLDDRQIGVEEPEGDRAFDMPPARSPEIHPGLHFLVRDRFVRVASGLAYFGWNCLRYLDGARKATATDTRAIQLREQEWAGADRAART